MKLDTTWDWTELAESLAEGQEAMRKAGFDMGGRTVEGHATPVTSRPFAQRTMTVQDWLKLQNLFTQAQAQDRTLLEMQDRLNRQGKWILFLLISWVFSGMALALATWLW